MTIHMNWNPGRWRCFILWLQNEISSTSGCLNSSTKPMWWSRSSSLCRPYQLHAGLHSSGWCYSIYRSKPNRHKHGMGRAHTQPPHSPQALLGSPQAASTCVQTSLDQDLLLSHASDVKIHQSLTQNCINWYSREWQIINRRWLQRDSRNGWWAIPVANQCSGSGDQTGTRFSFTLKRQWHIKS